MLWCKIARSPHAHAKILNIDTSRAEKLPGVKKVLTGKDFKGWKWGWMPKTREEEPLAAETVRYLGEAVAAVAAIDEDTAEEAAQLIEVEYEKLPGVFDPEEAMKEGAPQLYEHAKNNISWDFHMDFGDVEKGLKKPTWSMRIVSNRPGDHRLSGASGGGRHVRFIGHHHLGRQTESLLCLPASGRLFRIAPIQGAGHPTLYRRGVRRHQE